ncbi:MAG: hypothetical protein JSW11_12335 [Candidatus Heimdallarchaeota archaeon]|nr:MAG: hypothetical protein JSW11_12335 [Candidatus Heimdallarchaeota archaeon]
MKRATLHEIFHTYDAKHVSGYYIMRHEIQYGGWVLHSNTDSTVSSNDVHFDGPP